MPDKKADRPKTIEVELHPKVMRALAELMPPCTNWAREQGEPDPTPGEVMQLAVLALHSNVYEKAHNILASIKVPPGTKH